MAMMYWKKVVRSCRAQVARQLLYWLRGIPFTREQLSRLLRQAKERELLDEETLKMMEGVTRVTDLKVEQVMVSRAQMVTVDVRQSLEDILPQMTSSAHSRFPVTDGDRDTIIGILFAKDVLRHLQESGTVSLPWDRLLRPAVFIPESKRLNVLLQEFRLRRNHMAIVVDEYGGVTGLVTIEDVLEQIVGQIEDEHDVDEGAAMVLRQNSEHLVVRAALPVTRFNELVEAQLDETEFDTLGGAVTDQLGHVPQRGEKVELQGHEVEVLSADARQARLLRVARLPAT
ncbi:MAG: transporter associated domain-containing protein [Pseudomonadota bacterium]|jgi:magnesium and cobalt transporter|nr:transporter associated domain-containing protein [Pseudomonadota bacterium]